MSLVLNDSRNLLSEVRDRFNEAERRMAGRKDVILRAADKAAPQFAQKRCFAATALPHWRQGGGGGGSIQERIQPNGPNAAAKATSRQKVPRRQPISPPTTMQASVSQTSSHQSISPMRRRNNW